MNCSRSCGKPFSARERSDWPMQAFIELPEGRQEGVSCFTTPLPGEFGPRLQTVSDCCELSGPPVWLETNTPANRRSVLAHIEFEAVGAVTSIIAKRSASNASILARDSLRVSPSRTTTSALSGRTATNCPELPPA